MSTKGEESLNALQELAAEGRRANKKRKRAIREKKDDDGLLPVVRNDVFQAEAKRVGYNRIMSNAPEAFDRILKSRVAEFIKDAVLACDLRNGSQLTEADAFSTAMQANYLDLNRISEMFPELTQAREGKTKK